MRLLMVLALATLTGGCGVPKKTHNKVLDQLTATRAELEASRQRRQVLEGENERLAGELATGGERDQGERTEKLVAQSEDVEEELLALRARQAAADERLATYRELATRLRPLVEAGKLSVSYRNGQMALELPAGALFPSGRAGLTAGGKAALDEVISILADFQDRRLLVAGHTDSGPSRGRHFPSSWHLSAARAASVVTHMIEAGFAAEKLGAAGYGELDPAASNGGEEGRQQNRIEIILMPDLSELPDPPKG